MTGRAQQPLISPAEASRLLDDMAYARVIDCIDFDALLQFEIELWHTLEELGQSRAACLEQAQALIAGALHRLIAARAEVTDESLADVAAEDGASRVTHDGRKAAPGSRSPNGRRSRSST